ncbi:MAG TPA: hypothetical protein VHA35_19860 [Dongiaceae bacterium]|nr:hypothetical protein [Dongiaceae bacterium]
MTGLLHRCLRALALLLLVAGLALPPATGGAHVAIDAAASAADMHAAPCGHDAGHAKPAGSSHRPDCCIAGACSLGLGLPAVESATRELAARFFAYAPRVVTEPLGIDALPATDPPKAA